MSGLDSYESELITFLRAEYGDMMHDIAREKDISDITEDKLREALKAFGSRFQTSA